MNKIWINNCLICPFRTIGVFFCTVVTSWPHVCWPIWTKKKKKSYFYFVFLAPWWHFRELLCMSGVRIPRARTTVWRGKKNADFWKRFTSDLSKRNCHISAAEDAYAYMLQPWSCFLFPSAWLQLFFGCLLPRGCGHISVYTVHVIDTWHANMLEYMEHLSLFSLPNYIFLLVFLLFISRR